MGLRRSLGQPFVVVNRPGANTSLGMLSVARAPPDGHMLPLASVGLAANSSLSAKLKLDARHFVAGGAGLSRRRTRLLHRHLVRVARAGAHAGTGHCNAAPQVRRGAARRHGARAGNSGAEVVGDTPLEFCGFIKDETERLARVIRAAKIGLD